MSIILTCGHKVEDVDDCVCQSIMDFDRRGERCINYSTFCSLCATNNINQGIVLDDEDEEAEWLYGILDYPY